jgi:dUTP pyrophosphatase
LKIPTLNLSTFSLPAYKSEGAAGLDLCTTQALTLKPFERALAPTGLKLAIPQGFEGQVRPRSGLALKKGITVLNSPGTIDADYRGEIQVILINLSQDTHILAAGERIAQLVIAPVTLVSLQQVEFLDLTMRGEKGFGSSGV